MKETDLAYVAGFFDGEGDCGIRMPKARNGKRYKKLEARLTQNDRAVLEWVKELFDCGSIHAKKDDRTPNTCHALQFSYRSARVFLTAIEPYLKVKKEHVTKLLDECGREDMATVSTDGKV